MHRRVGYEHRTGNGNRYLETGGGEMIWALVALVVVWVVVLSLVEG
jgi:hypothetical protein